MQWLRSIRGFMRVLVGLFLLAQLAGVVSSPFASARASTVASHAHHHHAHQGDAPAAAHQHGTQRSAHVDDCCALHAFFAGVLPSLTVVEHATLSGERIAPNPMQGSVGFAISRLDRPPKPRL